MIRPKTAASTLLIAALGALALLPAGASAAEAPAWRLTLSSQTTNFAPGATQHGLVRVPQYTLTAYNVGSKATSGTITLTNTLPDGLTYSGTGSEVGTKCSAAGQLVTCTRTNPVRVGDFAFFSIPVSVDSNLPEESTVFDQATISGGGAQAAIATTTTTISSTPAGFDFLPGDNGLRSSALGEAGEAMTAAGSHPEVLAVDLGFPSTRPGENLDSADGGLRDVNVYLPRGMVVNPTATVRCTEVQLEGFSCPDASVIGTATLISDLGGPFATTFAVYNVVPAPGHASTFAFSVFGILAHIQGGVHAGDYALAGETSDIIARFGTPVLGVHLQLWGDPTAESHDPIRSEHCIINGGSCPVPHKTVPFISMPTSCTEQMEIEGEADSWIHPNLFHLRRTPISDNDSNPSPLVGCAQLDFQPTLKARPTTNVADAPTGLDVDLQIPQTNDLDTLATAQLRKAEVTLPEGLVVNPSSANGLEGCSSDQIGIDPVSGVPNGNPVSCPAASRIGSIEVDTPLLDHPLPGSVFIASPHDNPFDSLLAIYAVIDDPATGVLIKLPGHVVPDPQTGRLTTTFDQSPQLPFSSFRLSFFGGATAPLRTPATCGDYSTTSQMTPWSAPDSGPPAAPHDDYTISQGPGGACASEASAQPNSPSFDAGSISPVAAHHSPFVVHLRRNDGTQNFSALNVSPPPGLAAKLIGTAPCPDAALAAAAAKSGNEEKQSPSCPSSSEVGTFVAGAGAGPAPYYAPGKVYLSGPYKGAPLSFAFIAPAVAGPYDLGTVVTRAAAYIDPATGRVNTVSDPLPRILGGIPLDIRTLDVALDRPEFTLNGTSCEPSAVEGQLTSVLGQVASLSSRFQLAECTQLAFKPKLAIRLIGGTTRSAHPALRATLTMPTGGANLAQASVALPRSEFLDQAHIGTVCTRVQFAANQCPAASVYGHVSATSPLVPYALEGPVYLRSSSHELPDLVMDLHGPPYQPIRVEAAARVDSIKGGIRTTFEGIPDLPVSRVVLSMAGQKKGLLQNSTNICKGTHKANGEFTAQNGLAAQLRPLLRNSKCRGAARHHKKHRGHSR